jgi:hypothetical protein
MGLLSTGLTLSTPEFKLWKAQKGYLTAKAGLIILTNYGISVGIPY